MKPHERVRAAKWIRENGLAWGIGEVGPGVINRVGMGRASKMVFRRAILDCNRKLEVGGGKLDFLLIDAFFIPYVNGLRRRHQKPIIKGDQKSLSIAAASIIAKVYRDSLMRKLGRRHRVYGWAKNKGYGTREHQKAILVYGLTRFHRKKFVETWESKLEVKRQNSKVQVKSQNFDNF